MYIDKIAADRSIALILSLTRDEARDLRNHLDNADWDSLNDTAKDLFHFLDTALTPSRRRFG